LENHTKKNVSVSLADQSDEQYSGQYTGNQLLNGFYNAKQTLLSR